MIVFEVRSDGTVVSTPSLVAQGTSLSDLVVLADADYSLVTMHFTPPSGIYIPDVVFTPTPTQGRNLWQAVMPPEISRISGAVTYQIFLTSADGKTLATPTGRITVQEGVISNMPETAEELGQYSISALYQLMANFYASLEGYRQTLDGLTVKTYKWTILASDWTDSTPYQASIVFPHGNYAKPGTLILVAPADNRSREQIEKGELTVTVHDNGVIGDVPFVDTAVIVRGGKAPTEDINLVLFFIDTQGKDEPMTQWIGVDMGTGLPEVTPEDDGKVLTVDKNGDVAWGDPQGMEVYEITSPEEITADSPDGFYIQEGGTSTPSGGTTIHYFDSLDQVPADFPEGSFAAVPSTGGGGGGLPVVELTTQPKTEGAALTEAENALIDAIGRNAFLMSISGASYCYMCLMTPTWVNGVPVPAVSYSGSVSIDPTNAIMFKLELSEETLTWTTYIS